LSEGRGLLIIDPSVVYAEEEATEIVARGWAGTVRVRHPGLDPEESVDATTPYDHDAVVILGSRASVHDDLPWLRGLSAWLAPIVSGSVDVPLLGVCFGHQLIAWLAGAPVGPARVDGAKVEGVVETRVRASRLAPGRTRLRVVASHRETVLAVPDGWTVAGDRADAPVDILEHPTRRTFSVQFHPEAREGFALARGIAVADIDARVREDGDRVLSSFRDLALRQ